MRDLVIRSLVLLMSLIFICGSAEAHAGSPAAEAQAGHHQMPMPDKHHKAPAEKINCCLPCLNSCPMGPASLSGSGLVADARFATAAVLLPHVVTPPLGAAIHVDPRPPKLMA